MENKQLIKSFSIKGLFGTTDLVIPFDGKAKILIGENGLGKTQVLNMLFYTLKGRFEKLVEFSFDMIILEFVDGGKVEITKPELDFIFFNDPIVKDVITRIGMKKFNELYLLAQNYHSLTDFRFSAAFKQEEFDIFEAISRVRRYAQNDLFNPKLKQNKKIIEEHTKELDILYFPTYRRVEEDLLNLGYDKEAFKVNEENTPLIHFGMEDVEKRLKEIENQIETLLKEGLSIFLKDVLRIVMSKNTTIDPNIFERINEEDLAIIFARAKNLDTEIKEAVLTAIKKKEFNDPLSGLILQKLVELYENQKELDKAVIVFRDVCNKYLYNKQLIYDESSIEIYIQLNDTKEKIALNKLSSGEKQIISILSKVYLAPEGCNFMVLFDEPELSLSIFWQKNLLPDIFNSGRCQFLFAATHSPFIFDNELDKYAIGLSEYMTPIKPISIV